MIEIEKELSKIERQRKIQEILASQKRVKVKDICSLFNVSKATARRDLDDLAISGKVIRFHGGAFKIDHDGSDKPIIDRTQSNAIEKSNIGKAAANLVHDGDTIFLASGSTVLEVAKNLHGKKLVVVTNSILVMNEFVDDTSIELISTGGVLRRSEKSFIGHLSQKSLENIRADMVFLGIYAINHSEGLTHDFLREVTTDRAIMCITDNVIIVADHSKFQREGSVFLAPLTSINTIVTDSCTEPEILEQIRASDVRVIVT